MVHVRHNYGSRMDYFLIFMATTTFHLTLLGSVPIIHQRIKCLRHGHFSVLDYPRFVLFLKFFVEVLICI